MTTKSRGDDMQHIKINQPRQSLKVKPVRVQSKYTFVTWFQPVQNHKVKS